MSSAERLTRVVIVGHVDHGKSTLVGRLLADSGALPEGKLERVRATCERTSKPFEYAFLLDALRDEQAQGITIDVARVFFRSRRRPYVLLDAPGHREFLRNMVTGATTADAAVLVIDAQDGVGETSRRHATVLSLLGIRQVAVVVNKMDLVDWRRDAFDAVRADIAAFLGRLGVQPAAVIPASAREGAMLVTRPTSLDWHAGPTVLEALDAFAPETPSVDAPFRLPVQDVYKFTKHGDDRRIVAGTIETGAVQPGDTLVFHPSGQRARVRSLEAFARTPPSRATAGEAVGLTLDDDLYLTRGELACRDGEPAPVVTTRLRASVFWLGRQPLVPGRPYLLRLGTARVPAQVERVERVMDAASLDTTDGHEVPRHAVAEVVLALARPLACDVHGALAPTGRFVLVDDYEISGGGIVLAALPSVVTAHDAAASPAVIWLTGLSGAGKSTIAEVLVRRLEQTGRRVELLDGDAIRHVFPSTGFSRPERDAHIRRVGFLASRLEAHGVTVIASLVSPYRDSREFVRGLCRTFVEVHVATPLEECERRDPKGLYARARAGLITQFTGLDDPYEPPDAPELTLETTALSPAEAAERILAHVTGTAGRRA